MLHEHSSTGSDRMRIQGAFFIRAMVEWFRFFGLVSELFPDSASGPRIVLRLARGFNHGFGEIFGPMGTGTGASAEEKLFELGLADDVADGGGGVVEFEDDVVAV